MTRFLLEFEVVGDLRNALGCEAPVASVALVIVAVAAVDAIFGYGTAISEVAVAASVTMLQRLFLIQ